MSHLLDKALTTPDAFSSELGIPTHQDGGEFMRISRYILVASDMFTKQVGFDVHYVEDKTSQVGQPRGRNKLIIRDHGPLQKIHEIKYKDKVINPDHYVISNPELGWVRNTKRTSWKSTQIMQSGIRTYKHELEPLYQVTYDAGWVTPHQANEDETLERDLPHDIEQAVLELSSYLYQRAGSDTTVQSKSTGDWSVSYGDRDLPVFFEMVTDKYKRMI